jgi:hypothetical protein
MKLFVMTLLVLAFASCCVADNLFLVNADKTLTHAIVKDDPVNPRIESATVGTGFNFLHVFDGPGDSLFEINRDFDLLWHRFQRTPHGLDFTTSVRVGHGFRFSHIIPVRDGQFLAVAENGDLLLYSYGGWGGNAIEFQGPPAKKGDGWRYKHIFAGRPGEVFGVDGQDQMNLHEHDRSFTFKPPREIDGDWRAKKMSGSPGGRVYLTTPHDELIRVPQIGTRGFPLAPGVNIDHLVVDRSTLTKEVRFKANGWGNIRVFHAPNNAEIVDFELLNINKKDMETPKWELSRDRRILSLMVSAQMPNWTAPLSFMIAELTVDVA